MMRINHYFNLCVICFLLTQVSWASDSNANEVHSTKVDYIRLSNKTALNRLIYADHNGVEHLEATLVSLRKWQRDWCYYDLAEIYAGVRVDGSLWTSSRTLQAAVKVETECSLDDPVGARTVVVNEELEIDDFIRLNEILDQFIQSESLLDRIRTESGHPITADELYSIATSIELTPDGFRSEHRSPERLIKIDWVKVSDGYEVKKLEAY